MKSLLALTAAAAFAVHSVSGHYIFQQFTAGGTKHPAWKYVRRNSNPAWLQNGPVTDLSSTDLRCNVGGQTSNGTETVTMSAGGQFTFTLDTAVYHAGPVSLYMSKAPGAAADYDGSGQWFKIFDWGPSGWDWPMRGEFYYPSVNIVRALIKRYPDSYTHNIPQCIPDGEYLLRIQQIGLHNPGAAPQVRKNLILPPGLDIGISFDKTHTLHSSISAAPKSRSPTAATHRRLPLPRSPEQSRAAIRD
jgi:hypothetical protein